MNTKFANTVKALGLLCLLVPTLAHADARLEDFSVMASGPLDGRAVVKSADGKMTVLKVGDKLPGTEATLIQVLADKLVVEESVGKPGKPKVKQTAWLIKGGKSAPGSVQRFDSQGPVPVKRELTIMKPLGKVQDKAKVHTDAKKLDDKKPAAKKPESTKTETKKPDVKKQEAKQVEAKKLQEKKPQENKPALKKPESDKPAQAPVN